MGQQASQPSGGPSAGPRGGPRPRFSISQPAGPQKLPGGRGAALDPGRLGRSSRAHGGRACEEVGGSLWEDLSAAQQQDLGHGDLPPTISSLFRLLRSGNFTVTGNERFGGEARVLSTCVFP